MAASTAGAAAGASGGTGGGIGWLSKLKEKIEAKKAGMGTDPASTEANAQSVGQPTRSRAVAPHGNEVHTGGGGETGGPKRKKMWGGLGGALGGLFYKMPASGAKYGNSPINKNFGDAEARGFKPAPGKMNTFGIGSPESMSGVGSDMEPPLELE